MKQIKIGTATLIHGDCEEFMSVMIETDALGFTTKHEIRFIENIGLNKFGCLRVMESRSELIVKYIRAAEKRTDWAGMDKDIVLSTAKKLLREV